MSHFHNLDAVERRYAVAVSPHIMSLLDPADPNDPLTRQFLPSQEELKTLPEERHDPIGDLPHSPVHGIVHRYRDRVLLKIVAACPVYCRFCFRREMVGPGKGEPLTGAALDRALAYISAHPEINEAIITGGDPFILSPRRIQEVTARLAAIPHVTHLRWHTRVPTVDPERVTDDLAAALVGPEVSVRVAIHANHAREFAPAARRAIAKLAGAGVGLLSQSVLLRGVNDHVEALTDLIKAFHDNHIKPYYLHHPDLAPGTSHFRLSIPDGLALMKDLRARLQGMAVPTYMLDIPGGFGKIPLESDHLQVTAQGIKVRDLRGAWHSYP